MRLTQLDVLRGIAILLVLGRHKYVADLWLQIGWTGVDLFFVLSGFLIGGLLFNEYKKYGSIARLRFLIRRGFKIYPMFYLLIAVTVGIEALLLKHAVSGEAVLSEVLFVQNYGPRLWWHTWSLAVEEHFYLLLPTLLVLLIRRNQGVANPFRGLPRLILGLSLVLLAARLLTVLLLPYDLARTTFATHLRIDSLLFGVLLAYLHHFHGLALAAFMARWRGWVLGLSCLLIAPCLVFPVEHPVMYTIGFTLLYLGFGGWLLCALYGGAPSRRPAWLESAQRPVTMVLAFIGVNSYAIYLWHLLLVAVVETGTPLLIRGPAATAVGFAFYVISAVIIGFLMTRLVEAPLLRLRDRLYPGRSRSLETPPAADGESATVLATAPLSIEKRLTY